jgi:hypothetical protein
MKSEIKKKAAEELTAAFKSLEEGDDGPLGDYLRTYWDGKIKGCYDTKRLASYYKGNEDEDTGANIEDHVKECPVCAYDLGEIRRIGEFYAENFNGDVPADFIVRRRKASEDGLRELLAQNKERLATRENGPNGNYKGPGV